MEKQDLESEACEMQMDALFLQTLKVIPFSNSSHVARTCCWYSFFFYYSNRGTFFTTLHNNSHKAMEGLQSVSPGTQTNNPNIPQPKTRVPSSSNPTAQKIDVRLTLIRPIPLSTPKSMCPCHPLPPQKANIP